MSSNLPIRPLTDEQKAFLIEHLARGTEYEDIKSKFQLFFETGIDGSTIIQVKAKYSKLIDELIPQVRDPRESRLAHARTRLDELDQALNDAKTLRPVGPAIRIGENEWSPAPTGMNIPGIVAICRAAREEEYMAKKFMLEVKKMKLEADKAEILDTGFSEIVINTGIDE